MNVIIDECVPCIVKRRLPGRQIKTVQEMSWVVSKMANFLNLSKRISMSLSLQTRIFAINKI